jgi:hypothetical protein
MDIAKLAIVISAVDSTGNIFSRVGKGLGDMDAKVKKLTDAGKHWQAIGAKADKIGTMAGIGAGALGAIAAPAIAKIASAQGVFAQVQNLTRKTDSEMKVFRDQIYQIASDTGQGVEALLESSMSKIRSGMDGADVFKSLKQESLYATADASKNIGAFTQMTKAMVRQMGLSVDEASESYSGLFEISQKGGVKLDVFAQGSEALFNEAAALGMTGKKAMNQVYSAVQVAAKDASSPEAAMANVGSLLADIRKAKTEKAFEKLGFKIDHEAAWQSGDYLKNIVGQVMKATGGLGKAKQEAILSSLFKSDASMSAVRSLSASEGEYKNLQDIGKGAKGDDKAKESAKRNMKTLSEQWGAFQTQLMKAGDSKIVPWLEKLTDVLGWLTKDTVAAKITMNTFLGLFAVAGATKGIKFGAGIAKSIWDIGVSAKNTVQDIKGATKATGSFREGLGLWAKFKFPNMTGAIRGITGGIKSASIASWKFVASLWAQAAAWAATPIGMITIAIGALVAGGILIYKNWDKISAFFKKFWGWIKGAFSSAWDWITGLFKKVPSWLTWFFPIIKIPQLIIQNWDTIKGFFSGLWSWVTGAFSGAWGWFTGFVTRIPEAFLSVIGNVKSAISRVWSTIMGFFSKFKEAGKNIIQSIWDGIKGMIGKPVEAIKGMVGKIRNFLPFSPAKEGPLKDLHKIRIIETIADTIKPGSLTSKMGNALKAATSIAVPAITAIAPGARSAAAPSVQIVINIDARGAAPGTEQNIKKAIMDAMPDIERRLAQSAAANARALNRP